VSIIVIIVALTAAAAIAFVVVVVITFEVFVIPFVICFGYVVLGVIIVVVFVC
jgi:hypothetical protein